VPDYDPRYNSGTATLRKTVHGNCASFQVELEAGRITRAVYRCTTCVTLVALCEHLAELAVGSSVEEAAAWEAQLLLRRHPEVPRERRDRAE